MPAGSFIKGRPKKPSPSTADQARGVLGQGTESEESDESHSECEGFRIHSGEQGANPAPHTVCENKPYQDYVLGTQRGCKMHYTHTHTHSTPVDNSTHTERSKENTHIQIQNFPCTHSYSKV